jgi:MFS family permease
MVAWKNVKVPLTGFAGVGTGASIGTLAAEWTSRSTGQTAWNACAVKAGVKGLIGLLGYGISTRIGGPLGSFFAEMFAYGSWGSIFFDIALAAYPGGIPGLAEDWASTTRVYAAGGRKVVRELGTIERTAGVPATASAVF